MSNTDFKFDTDQGPKLTVIILARKKTLFISGFQGVEEPAELQHD
jgi:hypothetical protein